MEKEIYIEVIVKLRLRYPDMFLYIHPDTLLLQVFEENTSPRDNGRQWDM